MAGAAAAAEAVLRLAAEIHSTLVLLATSKRRVFCNGRARAVIAGCASGHPQRWTLWNAMHPP